MYGCPYGYAEPTKECTFTGEYPCYKPTEALAYAQTAFFVSIVVVQWADLIICKTRKLSIYHQGMWNTMLNFGLFSETALATILCYVPPLNAGMLFTMCLKYNSRSFFFFFLIGLGTRPLMFVHWLPGLPFSILIFLFDETRKYFMRKNPGGEFSPPFDSVLFLYLGVSLLYFRLARSKHILLNSTHTIVSSLHFFFFLSFFHLFNPNWDLGSKH